MWKCYIPDNKKVVNYILLIIYIMKLSPMPTPMNIFYFLYCKKSYFLYNDYTTKRKKMEYELHKYNPANKYIINKIMNK